MKFSTSLPSKSSKRMTQMTWLYALEASHDHDPGPNLEKIWAPLLAINFADHQINPPGSAFLNGRSSAFRIAAQS
jgi:hypothetical protein